MLFILISIVLAVLILVFDEPLLRLLFGRVEADVMAACLIYLFITTLTLPAITVNNPCSSILISMSDTKTSMRVSVIKNILNVTGNYIGIFILHAGVAGVAVPSLISRMVATGILLYVCHKKDRPVFYQVNVCLYFSNLCGQSGILDHSRNLVPIRGNWCDIGNVF